jgi:hypothetical protein
MGDDAVLQALANACVKYDNGWTGCLDLKEPREDPRAKNVGDDISIDESAAAADGHRQRELQPGSEIEVPTSVTSAAIALSPKLWFGPKTSKAEDWKLWVEQFAEDSIVVEHHAFYLDAKWLCRTGHVHWVPMPSVGLGWGFSELDHKTWDKPEDGWKVWDPHIPNRLAGLPAADLGANARATGEVLAAQQSSNNDKGDVENTIQVLAELKKQQREAPFKAPQMDAPGQHPVLAESPATNPADAHSTKKFGLHQPRPSPDSPSSVTRSSTAATTPRPPARHALEDLFDQDSVVGSGGFDSDSDGIDY